MPHFQCLVSNYTNDVSVKTVGLVGRQIVFALLLTKKILKYWCHFSQNSEHAKYSSPTKYLDTEDKL